MSLEAREHEEERETTAGKEEGVGGYTGYTGEEEEQEWVAEPGDLGRNKPVPGIPDCRAPSSLRSEPQPWPRQVGKRLRRPPRARTCTDGVVYRSSRGIVWDHDGALHNFPRPRIDALVSCILFG